MYVVEALFYVLFCFVTLGVYIDIEKKLIVECSTS